MTILSIHGKFYFATKHDSNIISKKEVLQMMKENKSEGRALTLLIYDESDKESNNVSTQLKQIMKDAKVSCDFKDYYLFNASDFKKYKKICVAMSNLQSIDDFEAGFENYTKEGGKVIFFRPPDVYHSNEKWKDYLGIKSLKRDYTVLKDFKAKDNFMIGAGQTFKINSVYKNALVPELENTKILATDGSTKIPVIWEKNLGKGKIVVMNFPDCGKIFRGICWSAYSKLDDVCVWPVIDSSTFFIDDFPAPVVKQKNEKLEKEYGETYDRFLQQHWWPDVMEFGKEYGITYTGLIIENYTNDTSGQIVKNLDTGNYVYFGNNLLANNGKIGIHGYNHQPLCLNNFQYSSAYASYNKWKDYSAMKAGLSEVIRFEKKTFPQSPPSAYVSPSNILSDEGRKMIGKDFPEINAICSTYTVGNNAYTQEFEIADDGVVEAPRIVSGEDLTDNDYISAFSELNFHYVNTHFMHPDDILDQNRTGDKNWEQLSSTLSKYMKWVKETAPDLQNRTASDLAGAVQRFYLSYPQTTITENGVDIHIDGFISDVALMMRINNSKTPKIESGGKIEKITDEMYLITCNAENVKISWK